MEHRRSDRDDIRIANEILKREFIPNIVHNAIKSNRFGKLLREKEYATLLVPDILPNLTENDLRELAFGNYQTMADLM